MVMVNHDPTYCAGGTGGGGGGEPIVGPVGIEKQ